MTDKEMTLAQHDAAVEEARSEVLGYLRRHGLFIIHRRYLDALIAAAVARGAAKERARECDCWRGEVLGIALGHAGGYCPHCGGRVTISEEGSRE